MKTTSAKQGPARVAGPTITMGAYIAWPSASGGIIVLAVVAVIVLFLAAVAIELVRSLLASRRQRRQAEERFVSSAREKGLTDHEIALCQHMARSGSYPYTHVVVNSNEVFDRCVERDLAELKANGASEETIKKRALALTSIRNKYGLDFLPLTHPLPSTRSLRAGQRLTLELKEPGEPEMLKAVVAAVDDYAITVGSVTSMGAAFALCSGQRVKVRFWRPDDGRYLFDAKVKSVDAKEGHAALDHPAKIERRQSRKFYRMRVDLPISFELLETEDPHEVEHAETRDSLPVRWRANARVATLSAGGVSILTDDRLSVESVIKFRLITEPGEASILLFCRVVSVATTPGGRYLLRGAFIATQQADVDKIASYIAACQQEQTTPK